jgi:hypothetical protein
MFDTYPTKVLLDSTKPYALSPVPNSHPGPKKSFISSVTGLVRSRALGLLTTSPTGDMNAALVFRTWGLTKEEPYLPGQFYGPNFTYQEYRKAPNAPIGMMIHYGLFVATVLLLCSPVRALMRKVVYKPGDGPDKEAAKTDITEFRAVAKPDGEIKATKEAVRKFKHTGSMYYCKSCLQISLQVHNLTIVVTAVLLAQAAATILQDDTIKLTGGIYAPACLGQPYIDRLKSVGVQFEADIQDL